MKRVLQIINDNFHKNEVYNCHLYTLCGLSEDLFGYHSEESKGFKDYINEHKTDNVFYSASSKKQTGDKNEYGYSMWHWDPRDYTSRKEWLIKHIKLNT